MKKLIILGVALISAVALSGCSTVSTDPDEIAIHADGGPIASKKLKECVQPSNKDFNGPGDHYYYFPTGDRTFSFTGRKGSEIDPIKAKTKNSVNLTVSGYATFNLNTEDCGELKDFFNKLGRKYGAYAESSGKFANGALPEGWLRLLGDYFVTPLNTAIDNAGLKYDWKELSYSAEAQASFEQDVKDALPGQLDPTFAKYITIKSIQISPPEPPQDLVTALEAAEKARAENDAQKQKNATARTKYQQIADCKKVASESYCLTQYLADNGDIPFYLIPQDSNLHIDGLKK